MAETGKQSSYKKLFSNTLVFAIGSFSSKVLVLLLVPIYTNYLTTAELGVTDVLTQIANWIIPLVTMTITEAIIRFGLDKAYDKVKVFTLGNLICFFGLAVFGILLPIVSLTGIADKYIGGYSLILYIYVFTSSMKSLYSTFVRAMEQVKLFAFNGILTTFFTLFWTAMFYMVLPEGFLGHGTGIEKYLLATILSDLISVVFLTFKSKLWRYINFKDIDRELLQVMLQYSVPLIPAQLLWLITNSSDSFMTTHYLGSDYNGVLSAAYKIPNLVSTVYLMFGQAWNMSAITEDDSDDRDSFYENVFDFNQSLLYILVAGCLPIVQPVTNFWIGADFRDCVKYSPIIIYATIYSCFTTFMGSIYLASKQTKRSLFTSLVSGVINVGLNVILIPRIGLYGPPISTVAAYMTVFIIRAIDSRKLVPFRIDMKKMIVNNIVILVMMFICLFETDLMHHLPLYAIVTLLFFAVFILNRKAVESIFYKVLPARIASHFVSLSTAKLCAVIGGLAVFVLIDLLTRGIIVYALLLAGFVFAIYKNKNRLMYIFMVLMPLSLVFRHGMVWAAVAFLILAVAVIIKNRRSADVFIGIAALDILLGAAAGLWFGVLAAAVQTLVCGFIFRRQIWDKLIEWAYKKR